MSDGTKRMIYLVASGEYSAYSIDGVYSSREKAELASKLYCSGIEEWELDAMPEHPPGMLPWAVVMKRNGDVESVSRTSCNEMAWYAERLIGLFTRGEGEEHLLLCRLWTKDKEHAVKIANEKRVQMIANDEWPAASGAPA